MTNGKEILALIEALQSERDHAIEEKNRLQVEVLQLQEQVRKQKEEIEMWKRAK